MMEDVFGAGGANPLKKKGSDLPGQRGAWLSPQAVERMAPFVLGAWGLALFAFLFGFFAKEHNAFPSRQVTDGRNLLEAIAGRVLHPGRPVFPYLSTTETRTVVVRRPGAIAPGLTLLSGVGGKGSVFAKIIDADGHVLHRWDLDWFRLWPHASYLPADVRPRSRPGTHAHGMVLEANGDLVFNYENIGLMKVDVCGRPIWRLPRRTHHSIERDDAGNYWVPELDDSTAPDPELPNHKPVLRHYSILEISPGGRVLRDIPIFDLLLRNGYDGLLFLQSTDELKTDVVGDMLHVNKVAVFPASMTEGIFKRGDVMVSMRNLNSIFVFDPKTLIIKSMIFGRFVRQHDPRFVDGNTVSIFDNNNRNDDQSKDASRILTYSAKNGLINVVYQGTPDHPFFSAAMGKQQRLENGDILVTEAFKGRAFELSPDKQIVWEYYNQTGQKGVLGLLDEAQRIQPGFLSASKLAALAAACPAN